MKNQYKKAIWSQRRPDGVELGLDASDVNHLQQIYTRLHLELFIIQVQEQKQETRLL